MKTTTTILTLTAASLLVASSPAAAQQRWAFELRANTAVTTEDMSAGDLGTGVAFEGSIRYRFLKHMAVYAGWDWTHFNATDSFAGPDMDFEETGYAFGLRWEHPLGGETGNGPALWLRGGATANHIEVEDAEGALVTDSGHGLGWEAGAGVSLALAGAWRFTPGLRYRSLSRDLESNGTTVPTDLRYVTFEVGLSRAF